MALRITLQAFSGLPDPTVLLDDREAAELVERLRPGRRRSKAQLPEVPDAILGYRGILFEQVGVQHEGLPERFRLAGGLLTGKGLRHEPADPAVEDFVCGSTGPFRRAGLAPETLDAIREQARRLREFEWSQWGAPVLWPVKPTCPCAPLYEPNWWNDNGQRQQNNNCYNYGTNVRTDTFAQPGRAAAQHYPWPITCSGARTAAIADTLVDTPNANNKCPKEGHLVALVVAPGPGFNDFHWYRKGRNGRWTHKPGNGQATNVDNAGDPITDPRIADRGPYTDFCTFMTVMHGHVKLS